jgi:glutaredoxin
MLNQKNILILAGTIAVIVGFVVWGLRSNQPVVSLDPAAIVYYYGDGCPHCKVVQEFIDANNIAEKVTFEKKEVWNDRKNSQELSRRAEACGVKPDEIGVPFVYGGDGKCYVGEPDVKKFFSEKAGIDTAEN